METLSWETNTDSKTHRLERIRIYVRTERRRRMEIRTKQGLDGTIAQTLGKWKTRQLEEPLKKLQQAADNNDMQPIWEFQSKLRTNKIASRASIKQQDGTERQGLDETLKRWEEWTDECCIESRDSLKPRL